MAAPSLSIIIPLYKAEHILPGLFATLERQNVIASADFSPMISVEILMIDDGSPDGTAEAVMEYAATHPNVRLITQPNSGQGEARNNGLRHARMRYVYLMDQDDLLVPDTLIPAVMLLEEHPEASLLRWQYDMPDESEYERLSNNTAPAMPLSADRIIIGHEYINETHGLWGQTCIWTTIVRRDFIRQHNICFRPDIQYLEDFIFVWPMMVENPIIIVSNQTRYHWIQFATSDSHIISETTKAKRRDGFPKLIRFFASLSVSSDSSDHAEAVNYYIHHHKIFYLFFYWGWAIANKALTRRQALTELDSQITEGLFKDIPVIPSDLFKHIFRKNLRRIFPKYLAIRSPFILRAIIHLKFK